VTSIRQGLPDAPGMARGVETLESIEVKLDAALERILPGAAPDLLDAAGHFLMRLVRHADMRRRHEREPNVPIWAAMLKVERESKEDARHRLLDAGVPLETLDRLAGLYPLAEDLLREERAFSKLSSQHGCWSCRHCFSSWERAHGDPDGAEGPFCEVFGGVPAFCFDFEASRYCRDCGTRASPTRDAGGLPTDVQCAACDRKDRAA